MGVRERKEEREQTVKGRWKGRGGVKWDKGLG